LFATRLCRTWGAIRCGETKRADLHGDRCVNNAWLLYDHADEELSVALTERRAELEMIQGLVALLLRELGYPREVAGRGNDHLEVGDEPPEKQKPAPEDLPTEGFITGTQFAKLLKVSQTTFDRRKAAGLLPRHIELSPSCHR
jgi:hypothetical protein